LEQTQGFPAGTQGGRLEEQGTVIAAEAGLWDDTAARHLQLSQRSSPSLNASTQPRVPASITV